jgi:drug/metabolite transporter (DMT)-like permease
MPAILSSPIARRVLLLAWVAVPTTGFFCLLRVVTSAGVPFLGLVFWQCVLTGLVFIVILVVRRTPIPLRLPHLRYYASSALFGLLIPFLGMTLASPNIPVGIMGLVFTIEPALTYLLALALLLERFHRKRFVGILIGIAGLALILLPQASLPSREMLPWVLVALSVPISWSIWSNLVAFDKPPEVDSAVAVCAMLILGSAMLVLPVLWLDQLWLFRGDAADLWWTLPVFVLFNLCLWLACFETIRLEGPVFYSTWTFLGTPLAIAAGMIFFAEQHSWWIWTALTLLLGSLYLVNVTMVAARRGT